MPSAWRTVSGEIDQELRSSPDNQPRRTKAPARLFRSGSPPFLMSHREVRHLYVHIPFCPKVCPYCSFYKEASDRNKTQRFLDSVLVELDRAKETLEIRPETIFFGGGTPSALSS